ncbi:MAG: homoserine dehydrogenase [Dehalococcoidales bacterium]|nr:homoserine dehydrogenase [Dehalococcoidales bacterium]
MKNIGIGLMGLGTVAGQVVQVLLDEKKAKVLADYVGSPVILRKVKVIGVDLERPLAKAIDSKLMTTDEEEFFNTDGIDIVVEAIGGEKPAFEYLKRALTGGKHVVTSNKEVIAKHGVELWSLAAQNNVGLHYEASAGGGIPLIAPFQRDLVANRIISIHAIINGTTNYILSRMAREGVEFATALKKAQELGYAESNPRNDLDGIDATYKLAILASLAFHCQVRPHDVYCEGVSKLTKRDFQYAKELGYAVKLLAIARQDDNTIQVRVHPVFLPEDAMLSSVDGVFNAIQVEGDLVGKLLFYGQGAGAFPTSSAVVADIASAAKDIVFKVGAGGWNIETGKIIRPMAEVETRYYLRMEVSDQPGVLAKISQVLGDHMISINSMLQKEANSITGTAEIVIMTHLSKEKSVQDALSQLKKLPVVKEICNFVRIEDVI